MFNISFLLKNSLYRIFPLPPQKKRLLSRANTIFFFKKKTSKKKIAVPMIGCYFEFYILSCVFFLAPNVYILCVHIFFLKKKIAVCF